jgi:hypothetical protein
MPYIRPDQVVSPKAHWELHEVLLKGDAGTGAYALGFWDGRPRVGFRWNGTDESPIGNPQSRGLPTWTMLDRSLHAAVISLLPGEKQDRVRRFLENDLRFEGVSLSDDQSSVLLWDLSQNPVIVAKVKCSTIRTLINKPHLSNDDCRLVANVNIGVLADVAREMFARECYSVNNKGVRVIDIGDAELAPIVPRLSLTVLQAAELARWVR